MKTPGICSAHGGNGSPYGTFPANGSTSELAISFSLDKLFSPGCLALRAIPLLTKATALWVGRFFFPASRWT